MELRKKLPPFRQSKFFRLLVEYQKLLISNFWTVFCSILEDIFFLQTKRFIPQWPCLHFVAAEMTSRLCFVDQPDCFESNRDLGRVVAFIHHPSTTVSLSSRAASTSQMHHFHNWPYPIIFHSAIFFRVCFVGRKRWNFKTQTSSNNLFCFCFIPNFIQSPYQCICRVRK